MKTLSNSQRSRQSTERWENKGKRKARDICGCSGHKHCSFSELNPVFNYFLAYIKFSSLEATKVDRDEKGEEGWGRDSLFLAT